MSSGVVTIGRQHYAVGLYWENSPGSGRVAQIAREAARQPGQQAEFYAVRPANKNGRIPQFALSSGSITGQKAGMPVLAGCLAGQIPGSWAGAFRFNEGLAVVIVRDDLIVPDGDLFFVDEGEARDRLIQEIGFGGLQSTYAPEAWSIPGADTVPVSLLINDRNDIKLQLVHIPKQAKIIAIGGVLGFLILVGGLWYWQTSDEDAKQMAQQQAKAIVPSVLMPPPPPPAPKYERKWESAPLVMDAIKVCHDGLAKVPMTSAGWHLVRVTCSGSTMTVYWTRDKGAGLPPEATTIDDGLRSATQVIQLDTLSPRGPELLQDPEVTNKRYFTQNWQGNLVSAAPDPAPPPPPGYTGAWNPPPPPWVKRSFTFTVPILPADLGHTIGDMPGVIIEKMDFSLSGVIGSWSIGGVIYENRK